MLIETKRCGRLWAEVTGTGTGTPIVLWHSVICSGRMWGPIPDALSRDRRVVNVDGPGHGRSSPTRAPYTLDDCVDAALDVLDAARIERAIWCGLSWGGMVGMRLALRAPERLEGLILIDSNGDREVPEKLPRYRALALLARAFGATSWLLDRLEPIFFSPHTLRANRAIVEQFREGLRGMDRDSIRHVVDAVILGRDDIRPRLRAIATPTLVLVGADDVATPRRRSEDLVAHIPGARLVEIPDAGHLSAWEQPDRVLAELDAFARTLDAGARASAG